MLAGPGIQRNEGMLGFDWATHNSDPVAADSDMDLTGLLPPSVETNKDRFDLVEALSGWNLDDTLRGDDRDAAAIGWSHELNAGGHRPYAGSPAPSWAGATTFTGGNILIGGAGTDLIEGRGGDDVIDGDAQLNVQVEAPNVRDPATRPTSTPGRQPGGPSRPTSSAGRIDPGSAPASSDRPRRRRQAPAARHGAASPVRRPTTPSPQNADGTTTVAHTGGTAAGRHRHPPGHRGACSSPT